jgi:hypothetical protein
MLTSETAGHHVLKRDKLLFVVFMPNAMPIAARFFKTGNHAFNLPNVRSLLYKGLTALLHIWCTYAREASTPQCEYWRRDISTIDEVNIHEATVSYT